VASVTLSIETTLLLIYRWRAATRVVRRALREHGGTTSATCRTWTENTTVVEVYPIDCMMESPGSRGKEASTHWKRSKWRYDRDQQRSNNCQSTNMKSFLEEADTSISEIPIKKCFFCILCRFIMNESTLCYRRMYACLAVCLSGWMDGWMNGCNEMYCDECYKHPLWHKYTSWR
jgi:hypothetical protein